MKGIKLYMALSLALILPVACREEGDADFEKEPAVSFMLVPLQHLKAAGGPDDLPEEYAIKDLSIFLAEPGSNDISGSFVHVGFSVEANGCALVSLPVDPSTASYKDVRIIANCGDADALSAVATLDDLKALETLPGPLTTAVMLTSGLPMYGQALKLNLGNSPAANPAVVTLTRACAKLRVSLENAGAGTTGNAFTVENAAPYALYVPGSPFRFGLSGLIDYPQVDLEPVAAGQYQGIAYICE